MKEMIRLARLMGKHLQETEVYAQMKQAEAACDADTTLQDQIGQFNLKRMNLTQMLGAENAEENGKEKIETLNADIQKLYGDIMLNPNMQLYSEAQASVSHVLEQVNAILAAAANGDDPELFDPEGCSGNCSSCGGCH